MQGFIGSNESGPVLVPAQDFLTHAVVLGRTGSGKSGLIVTLVEEAVRQGASVLVLDPKGDLTNLGLRPAEERDFQGWAADPFNAMNAHLEGVLDSGLTVGDLRAWNAAAVNVYTPGNPTAPIDAFPSFNPHRGDLTALREHASRSVGTILSAINEDTDKFGPARVFLSEVMVYGWSQNCATPVEEWPQYLLQPPMRELGGLPLDSYFPKKDRLRLARSLVGFKLHAARWLEGDKLNLEKLTASPQVAVLSLRHLSEEDRRFFTAITLNKVVDYMHVAQASKRLKLLVVLDEARGYLPPHPANPPTKQPICQLLAQGRAQGIGLVVGTQNPMDLDYKALSNVGTWFLGRLRERDCQRDLTTELRDRGLEVESLGDIPQRHFLLLDRTNNTRRFRVRHTLSYLKGPLELTDIGRLRPQAKKGLIRRLFA